MCAVTIKMTVDVECAPGSGGFKVSPHVLWFAMSDAQPRETIGDDRRKDSLRAELHEIDISDYLVGDSDSTGVNLETTLACGEQSRKIDDDDVCGRTLRANVFQRSDMDDEDRNIEELTCAVHGKGPKIDRVDDR